MGWDEIMTPDMPTTAVIHSWRGENEGLPNGGSLIAAAKKGYQTFCQVATILTECCL